MYNSNSSKQYTKLWELVNVQTTSKQKGFYSAVSSMFLADSSGNRNGNKALFYLEVCDES